MAGHDPYGSTTTMSFRQSRVPKARIVIFASVALLLLGLWSFSSDWRPTHTPTTPTQGSPPHNLLPTKIVPPPSTSTERAWSYDARLHRDNHSLTLAQCSAAFPDLYVEIDRAVDFWKGQQGKRKIGPDQISLKWSPDGGLRAMIYDQQLHIIGSRGLNHFGHWKERSHGTLHQIQRAILAAPEPIPNIEFTIKINDRIGLSEEAQKDFKKVENTTLWAFSRNIHDPVEDQVWVIPDFNFWTYPRVAGSFSNFQREALAVGGDNFAAKKDKLVWRGTTAFNEAVRLPLLKQAEGQAWSDVHKVVEDSTSEDSLKYKITLPDHCKYKFAVHTEGTTWSGRLKYLLSCHSAIVIHPLTYHTHLYHLLEPSGPNQNYVPVQADWADLPERMEELLRNKDKAQTIADNAATTFRDRYVTPAAQTCYWRQLFKVWSEMAFVPDPYEYTTKPDGRTERKWRGMTYEEYVFWEKDVPKKPAR